MAEAQRNHKPKIVGQELLSVNEDHTIVIPMDALKVEDRDDWFYPWGFTMTVFPGDNYSVSGNAITPATNFNGKLVVEVMVNDGDDDSNRFKLEIAVGPVNDKPVITGNAALSTNENQEITIQPSDLQVSDPDDRYPDDFSLIISGGSNYTVAGNTVTPAAGFSGTLSVSVTVNDGEASSDSYALPISVRPVDRVPEITGQVALQTDEDTPLDVTLSQLTVQDKDNHYPDGFSLQVGPGDNYSVSGATVTPAANFSGKISVPVTVSDGKNTSNPFNLAISVLPVNDVPALVELETTPLFFTPGASMVSISETVEVSEPDGDSIMFATVGIRATDYEPTADKLVYTAPSDSKIRGVFDPGAGVLMLLGQASPHAYTVAIRAVQYERLLPAAREKILYLSVNDGKSDSEEVTRTLRFGPAAVALDIPTGFTPNGDTANDTWKIIPLKSEEQFTNARIKVYNKAGILVYESIGLDSEWDGRLNGELLPADTYFYTIDLNMNAREGYLKGLVTILR